MGVEVKELPMNKNGKPVDEPGQQVVRRRTLVARKDFAAGEVIYKVSPLLRIPRALTKAIIRKTLW
jgi:hypothetical protein